MKKDSILNKINDINVKLYSLELALDSAMFGKEVKDLDREIRRLNKEKGKLERRVLNMS